MGWKVKNKLCRKVFNKYTLTDCKIRSQREKFLTSNQDKKNIAGSVFCSLRVVKMENLNFLHNYNRPGYAKHCIYFRKLGKLSIFSELFCNKQE